MLLGKCFSPFCLLQQNTLDWVAYKQQKKIFLTALEAAVKDQGSGMGG